MGRADPDVTPGFRIGFSYAALFLLFFLQLPLKGWLPGNTDTLLAIGLSNQIWEKLGLFLSGAPPFTAMYPARDVLAYGENCYGLAFVFLFFKLLTSSDLWGYYLFISSLCALNAFAVCKWVSLFVEGAWIPWAAGLMFALAGFTLSNVDDPNVVFVFFPVMALYFLELWARQGRAGDLKAALLLSGAQLWFGLYVFVFQLLCLALLLPATALTSGRKAASDLAGGLKLALAYLLPCAPLAALYLYNHAHARVFSPYNARYTAEQASMSWHSFWNAGPGNRLYSELGNVFSPLEVGRWTRLRKSGFPGFALPALALLGMAASYRAVRAARAYLAVFAVFFALSFGLHLPGFGLLLGAPLGGYLRVPSRFYLFALLPLVLFAAMGLERISKFSPRRARMPAWVPGLAAGAAACLVLAENVPFSLYGFDAAKLIRPPESYVSFFRDFRKPAVVLDLPSTCFYLPGSVGDRDGLWFYGRDALYVNWQTYHRQLIVGGVNGYVSATRAELDPAFQRVPQPDALRSLKAVGVQYIVFHKNLILRSSEGILPELKRSPDLVERLDDDEIAIFEVTRAS